MLRDTTHHAKASGKWAGRMTGMKGVEDWVDRCGSIQKGRKSCTVHKIIK